MIAHKFGGSSVADAERIARVVDLLLARDEPQVVVISAMQGVTDALLSLVKQAAARDGAWPAALQALKVRHEETARALLGDEAGAVLAMLERELAALHELLNAQALVGAVSNDLSELVAGLGEVWSSQLVDAAFRARGAESVWLDAREVLVVEPSELGAMVKWDASAAKLAQAFRPLPKRTVVTGFVARTVEGRITTLGRNGCDYSGAIFAALFGAKELHLWSDVDGVLSADPRLVPEAVLVERLSYSEACELAYFGAKVIHPQTMAPGLRARHSHHRAQHLQAFAGRHPHHRRARPLAAGEGRDDLLVAGHPQHRGRGNDRRAGHRRARLRGAQARGRLGGDDLRRAARSTPSAASFARPTRRRPRPRCGRRSRASCRRACCPDVTVTRAHGGAGGGGRRHGGHAGRGGAAVRRARSGAASTCASSPRAPRSGTSRW